MEESYVNISQESNNMDLSQDDVYNNETPAIATISEEDKPPPRYFGKVGNLRSIQEIPKKYQCIFNFPFFNIIQSHMLDDIFYSDVPVVVSAPTGSGKTVIFEVAIIRLLMQLQASNYSGEYKIIYVAPIKALCAERLIEWHQKFSKLGLSCVVVTGDSDHIECRNLKHQHIILTTPEKWDALTRCANEARPFIQTIKLFMIDEVHLLNEESRGPILEAIVSRLKLLKEQTAIRFMAVSATIPNITDIAQWLGSENEPALYFRIGDELRPVKLRKIVLGYPCLPNTSNFKFDLSLNYKLPSVLMQYSNGRPTLIFCNTRKGVEITAKHISQSITFHLSPEQKKLLLDAASTMFDNKIRTQLMNGVGSHHAGMTIENRASIEQLFRSSTLPVLVATSTLAMGVNLPAHLVIIKSTQHYMNGTFQDYSESTLLQMIGRAGRPQYDTHATVVIMTKTYDKERLERMIGGSQLIESNLHRHLTQHLNAEIVLHIITDIAVALDWLRSTFLYIRVFKNPKHYNMPVNTTKDKIEKKLQDLCQIEINALCRYGMLEIDQIDGFSVRPTTNGILMANYYLALDTMKLFQTINGYESLSDILTLVSKCSEFSETFLRVDDKRTLNTLNRCKYTSTIRFPLPGNIKTASMKVNCIIQAIFGCLKIQDPSLYQESVKIMRTGERICKALVEYLLKKENCLIALLNALTLSQCFHAQIWENSAYVSKQLHKIGPVLSSMLVLAGKTSFKLILETNPRDIERIINRAPPMGNDIQDAVASLPFYQIQLMAPAKPDYKLKVLVKLFNADTINVHCTVGNTSYMTLLVGDSKNNVLFCKKFQHNTMVVLKEKLYCIDTVLKQDHVIQAHLISENWVGIDCHEKIEIFMKETNSTSYKNVNRTEEKESSTLNKEISKVKPAINNEYTKNAEPPKSIANVNNQNNSKYIQKTIDEYTVNENFLKFDDNVLDFEMNSDFSEVENILQTEVNKNINKQMKNISEPAFMAQDLPIVNQNENGFFPPEFNSFETGHENSNLHEFYNLANEFSSFKLRKANPFEKCTPNSINKSKFLKNKSDWSYDDKIDYNTFDLYNTAENQLSEDMQWQNLYQDYMNDEENDLEIVNHLDNIEAILVTEADINTSIKNPANLERENFILNPKSIEETKIAKELENTRNREKVNIAAVKDINTFTEITNSNDKQQEYINKNLNNIDKTNFSLPSTFKEFVEKEIKELDQKEKWKNDYCDFDIGIEEFIMSCFDDSCEDLSKEVGKDKETQPEKTDKISEDKEDNCEFKLSPCSLKQNDKLIRNVSEYREDNNNNCSKNSRENVTFVPQFAKSKNYVTSQNIFFNSPFSLKTGEQNNIKKNINSKPVSNTFPLKEKLSQSDSSCDQNNILFDRNFSFKNSTPITEVSFADISNKAITIEDDQNDNSIQILQNSSVHDTKLEQNNFNNEVDNIKNETNKNKKIEQKHVRFNVKHNHQDTNKFQDLQYTLVEFQSIYDKNDRTGKKFQPYDLFRNSELTDNPSQDEIITGSRKSEAENTVDTQKENNNNCRTYHKLATNSLPLRNINFPSDFTHCDNEDGIQKSILPRELYALCSNSLNSDMNTSTDSNNKCNIMPDTNDLKTRIENVLINNKKRFPAISSNSISSVKNPCVAVKEPSNSVKNNEAEAEKLFENTFTTPEHKFGCINYFKRNFVSSPDKHKSPIEVDEKLCKKPHIEKDVHVTDDCGTFSQYDFPNIYGRTQSCPFYFKSSKVDQNTTNKHQNNISNLRNIPNFELHNVSPIFSKKDLSRFRNNEDYSANKTGTLSSHLNKDDFIKQKVKDKGLLSQFEYRKEPVKKLEPTIKKLVHWVRPMKKISGNYKKRKSVLNYMNYDMMNNENVKNMKKQPKCATSCYSKSPDTSANNQAQKSVVTFIEKDEQTCLTQPDNKEEVTESYEFKINYKVNSTNKNNLSKQELDVQQLQNYNSEEKDLSDEEDYEVMDNNTNQEATKCASRSDILSLPTLSEPVFHYEPFLLKNLKFNVPLSK